MSDIFNEIDEDLRRDQFRKLWDRYGIVVVGFAAAVVVAVAGWRGYDYWAQKRAEAGGAAYYAAVKLAEDGKSADAREALVRLERDGPDGYKLLSVLRQAALVARDDKAAGIKAYEEAARLPGLPAVMADLARIQAAYLAVDTEDAAAVRARVAPLNTAGNAFRHSAREILTLAAMKAGDWAAAKSQVEEMRADADLPQSLERRVDMLQSVIAASAPATAPKS